MSYNPSPILDYGSAGRSSTKALPIGNKRKRSESPSRPGVNMSVPITSVKEHRNPTKPLSVSHKKCIVRVEAKDVFGWFMGHETFAPYLCLGTTLDGWSTITLSVEDRQRKKYYENTWNMRQCDEDFAVTEFDAFRFSDRPQAYGKLSDRTILDEALSKKKDHVVCFSFVSWTIVNGSFFRGSDELLESQSESVKRSIQQLRQPSKPFRLAIWFYESKYTWDRVESDVFKSFRHDLSTRMPVMRRGQASQTIAPAEGHDLAESSIKGEVAESGESEVKVKVEEKEDGAGGVGWDEEADLYDQQNCEDDVERDLPWY